MVIRTTTLRIKQMEGPASILKATPYLYTVRSYFLTLHQYPATGTVKRYRPSVMPRLVAVSVTCFWGKACRCRGLALFARVP